MPFSHILAQDTTLGWLRRAMREDQVGHAFLFFGPEGIGKRTTALAFAMAMNCTDEAARAEADFCGVCRSCRMITLGQHPDVRLLTPETTGGKTVIPIDAIRTRVGESQPHPLPLREDAQLKPLEGRKKVYILDPANRPGLQEDAGNALLLTLEEPPRHVVIILVSSRPNAMLPTLVSRCRPVRFQLAPRDAVYQAVLQTGQLTEAQTAAVTGMAAGRIGWALGVANNPAALEARSTLLDTIDRLLPSGRPAALRLAETLHKLAASTNLAPDAVEEDAKERDKARTLADRAVRRNLPELLDIAASWWRDLLVSAMGHPEMRINADYDAAIDRHAGRLSPERLRAGLQEIMKTKRYIESNANINLALERLWMVILD